MDKNKFFRGIPKVDIIMENEELISLSKEYGRDLVLESVRKINDDLRAFINNSRDERDEIEIMNKIDNILMDIKNDIKKYTSYNIKKVINGTGTILHTNLGRAAISESTADYIKKLVTGYSNLEFSLEDGERGSRYSHFEHLITKITGAESAIAVNNNAAAVLLILSAFANEKQVIVSRGELVEIGGSFRVPDVMAQSGAKLVEVGTTNKTHFYDYEKAINEETAVLLKVHTSNYKIVGFTESVPVSEIVELGKKYNIPVIEDIGSGVLVDLSKYGLDYEPTVQESIKAGADLVCFSGDKLLGGPQAGIIVGKKAYIDQIKKHPLTRALRVDKFTAIALECIFHEYLDEEKAINNIPIMRMINKSIDEIAINAQRLLNKLIPDIGKACQINIEDCESQIGGGSLPMERIKSKCLSIKPDIMTTSSLEKDLRNADIPIIGRVFDDKFIIDLRTVFDNELDIVYNTIKEVFDR